MILVNDSNNIGLEPFISIKNSIDIADTKANSIVRFQFDIELMKYCQENKINFAVEVSDLKEIVYSNLLDARFIIVTKDMAIEAQKIAENYMFDSKILVEIESEDEISWVVKTLVDGAILK